MHASQYAELSMRCCSIRRLNQTGCRASDKVAADLAETTQLLLEDLKRPRASIGKVWKHGYSNDFWCYEIIGPLQPFGELLNLCHHPRCTTVAQSAECFPKFAGFRGANPSSNIIGTTSPVMFHPISIWARRSTTCCGRIAHSR